MLIETKKWDECMTDDFNENGNLTITAGDDFAFFAELKDDGNAMDFGTAEIEMVITDLNGNEVLNLKPFEYKQNVAAFYISSTETKALQEKAQGNVMYYSVRINWKPGIYTVLQNKILIIKGE